MHQSLPFSTFEFFTFVILSIVFVGVGKFFFRKTVAYKWILSIISLTYIAFLFPKPIHILGLIVFLYLTLLGLRRFYQKENIILPMVLLSLPIFALKTTNVLELNPQSDLLDIVRIAGLSYMVFRVIGLYIDERRHSNRIDFVDFFNFTAFTPTLLIGPLDRFSRFQKEVESGYQNFSPDFFYKGLNNFSLGLLFKFIFAAVIHQFILSKLENDGSVGYHFAYMYSYLLYLFFDFAGYSLLAIGFGNFLGVNVPINFDKPFLAVNPKEFWKKWHKSLGDWLNDYFFKPIFKHLTTQRFSTSIRRQNIALMLTFTLMGCWNGFELHFIVSGMLFGIYSVVHNYYIYRCKKTKKDVFFGKMSPQFIWGISLFLMFNLVAFAIYVFSGQLF